MNETIFAIVLLGGWIAVFGAMYILYYIARTLLLLLLGIAGYIKWYIFRFKGWLWDRGWFSDRD